MSQQGITMNGSLTLLDRAMILAQHELEAMRMGDVDKAQQHFDERAILMDQASKIDDEQDPADYRVKLIALQGYNMMIHDEGQELLNKIRQQLLEARIPARAMRGYAKSSHSVAVQ